MKAIQVGDNRATFLRHGPSTGKQVVLLHGGGLDCATLSWRCLLPDLSRTYDVIAPNWPGYGGTTPFGRPYHIGELSDWLIAFLDTLGIERAPLIGVSMGGGAALSSGLNRPGRVEALVLAGTYGVAPRAPYHLLSFLLTKLPLNAVSYAMMRRNRWALRRALTALFADPSRVTDELVCEFAQVLEASGNGEAFSQFQRGELMRSGLRTNLTGKLSDLTQPTLFIHGSADRLVPLSAVERAAQLIPNARLDVLDAGHWPMRERPDAFNGAVRAFLHDLDHS